MAQPEPLDDSNYERFRSLILERSGLHFPDKRRRDLEAGIWRAFSHAGCRDLETYYRLLAHNGTDGQAWEQLICQVTVGETYFFRDQFQFQALRSDVLPEIIARKRALTRQIRIWSAGCATGEEPYSIAMLLRDLVPDLADWNVTILATDINREALARARAGLYGDWSFRENSWEGLRSRYFTRRDKLWELSREVRNMVSFAYLNLAEDPYPSLANNTVAFDLILCRNVTIYFLTETTQRVVDQFYEALVEQGWLIVGHSEPSIVTYARFEPRNYPGAVLYHKTGTPRQLDLSWLEALEQPRPAPRIHTAPAPPAAPIALPSTVLPQEGAPTPADLYAQALAILEQDFSDTLSPLLPPVPAPPPAEEKRGAEPEVQEKRQGPAVLCTEAAALIEEGRAEKALEKLQRALEQDPECGQAYYLVAKIQANAGRWEDARYWCERALERDTLLAEAHFLLGLVHSQEGELDQARAAMKRVVYLDRGAALGHYWLANIYRDLGDQARARKSLENTVRLLEALPEEAAIPWSDGMTAGRLLYVVQQQMDARQVRRH